MNQIIVFNHLFTLTSPDKKSNLLATYVSENLVFSPINKFFLFIFFVSSYSSIQAQNT